MYFKNFGFGFFCSTADGKITTNRKLKLKNLNKDNLLKVFFKNLNDFEKLLEISKKNNFTIFRLGSNFIPFASHETFSKSWLKIIEKELIYFSYKIKNYNIRITMHPGQFVVLNSPQPEIVEKSLRELEYHFWVLDCLNLDKNCIVVVHLGGIYGNKEKSLERFANTLAKNKWLTKRLAVENDDKSFTVEDLLKLKELGLPLVYDHHHNKLNSSIFSSQDVLKTWGDRIPEFHISSSHENSNEHANYVKLDDFIELYKNFQTTRRIDIIVEAKNKEKAVLKLIKEIKNLDETKNRHNLDQKRT
ncbi:MAG: UV DNA damage repair endonuclease UvsE [Endomicrobiia bacterium]